MVHNHVVNIKPPKVSAKVHKKLEEAPTSHEKIKKAMAAKFVLKDDKYKPLCSKTKWMVF